MEGAKTKVMVISIPSGTFIRSAKNNIEEEFNTIIESIPYTIKNKECCFIGTVPNVTRPSIPFKIRGIANITRNIFMTI